MKEVLSLSGYNVEFLGEKLNKDFTCLQIQNEDAISNPEKIVTLFVKAGYAPNLLKVEKEDLEMYFLKTLEGMRNDSGEANQGLYFCRMGKIF